MRLLFSILLAIVASTASFSQENKKESYLILQLLEKSDRTNKTKYYVIVADPHNKHADTIYKLVPFSHEPYKNQTGNSFYFQKKDSSHTYFNYFRSQTEALEFISGLNWNLISVTSQIFSSFDKEPAGDHLIPYTTVTSRPLYYFRKWID